MWSTEGMVLNEDLLADLESVLNEGVESPARLLSRQARDLSQEARTVEEHQRASAAHAEAARALYEELQKKLRRQEA